MRRPMYFYEQSIDGTFVLTCLACERKVSHDNPYSLRKWQEEHHRQVHQRREIHDD